MINTLKQYCDDNQCRMMVYYDEGRFVISFLKEDKILGTVDGPDFETACLNLFKFAPSKE